MRDYTHYKEQDRLRKIPPSYHTYIITYSLQYGSQVSVVIEATDFHTSEVIDSLTITQSDENMLPRDHYNNSSKYIYKLIYSTLTHCIQHKIKYIIIQHKDVPSVIKTLNYLMEHPKPRSDKYDSYLPIINLIKKHKLIVIFYSSHNTNPNLHSYDHLIYNEDYYLKEQYRNNTERMIQKSKSKNR